MFHFSQFLIRDWLTNNKIFFETLMATLLSIMALVISFTQVLTTAKQTKLMDIQAKIAEAEALPQFEIKIAQEFNESTEIYDNNYIIVNNHGGPVYGFQASNACFITFETYDESLHNNQIIEIPINGFFSVSMYTAASTGNLVTMSGNNNNVILATLEDEIRKAVAKKGLPYGLLSDHHFVHLSYTDLLGRPHEDFYEVRYISGGSRIVDETGKTKFMKWEKALKKELSALCPDDFFNGLKR